MRGVDVLILIEVFDDQKGALWIIKFRDSMKSLSTARAGVATVLRPAVDALEAEEVFALVQACGALWNVETDGARVG